MYAAARLPRKRLFSESDKLVRTYRIPRMMPLVLLRFDMGFGLTCYWPGGMDGREQKSGPLFQEGGLNHLGNREI